MRKKLPEHLTETTIQQQIRIASRLTQISYCLFVLIFVANFYQLYSPTEPIHWLVGLAQLLPILIFAPAFVWIWRKGILGFCFILMLYFCFTVINLNRPVTWPWMTYAELIIEVGLLFSALYLGKQLNLLKLLRLEEEPRQEEPVEATCSAA